MDYDNYWDFYNGDPCEWWTLSDGSYYGDSGTFDVPYQDTWYIIFWNNDADMQTTYLESSVTYIENYFGGTRIDYEVYGYTYFLNPLQEGGIVDWYFEGTNTYVGIEVMAMDDTEFYDFQNSGSYMFYPLSDGSYYSDSGTFTVPYADEWYFVFWNSDSDELATDLNWGAIYDDAYEENDYLTNPAYIDTETWYYDLVALDDDCYSFYMETGETAYVDIYFIDEDGDLDLYLFDLDENVLAHSGSTTDNEFLYFEATYSGNYIICVATAWGTNDNYDLYVDIETSGVVEEFTIDASSGANGDIDPNGAQIVTEGDDITFTFDPDVGFMVDYVLVDDVDQGALSDYTFTDVQEDHSIEVYFIEDPDYIAYDIDASSGSNGDIDPSGVIVVTEGDDITFTFDPDTGYMVDYVLVDGDNKGSVLTYTFTDVDQDHTIEVYFIEDPDYVPPDDEPEEPFISGYSTYLLLLVMGVSVFVSVSFIRRRRMS